MRRVLVFMYSAFRILQALTLSRERSQKTGFLLGCHCDCKALFVERLPFIAGVLYTSGIRGSVAWAIESCCDPKKKELNCVQFYGSTTDADRLEPKGKWYGRGVLRSPLADNDATGEQVVPNPSNDALAEQRWIARGY